MGKTDLLATVAKLTTGTVSDVRDMYLVERWMTYGGNSNLAFSFSAIGPTR
jgi:hypothetical protein